MKNVFLIGNGFDLHHLMPTRYYDFMSVVKVLINRGWTFPITIKDVFEKCKDNNSIARCYNAHTNAYDNIELDSAKIVEFTHLFYDNLWYNYFAKTLDTASGWIDFEKEISIVIKSLDKIILRDKNCVLLPQNSPLDAFVLSNFRFFVDARTTVNFYEGETWNIKKQYLKEYPCNSGIYIANKKAIFEELYKQLGDFKDALILYFQCFVEKPLDLILEDEYINKHKIDLLNIADKTISFNYTSTLEKLYSDEKVHHVHGTIKQNNIVLGVNPNTADDSGTDNTALIKFKKYYQREVFKTDREYLKWHREAIQYKYRIITIGHSLDETDKDILSDMFLNADEIFITYYDEECRDAYIQNIVRIFGKDGYDIFRREKNMQFIPLSDISSIPDRMTSDKIDWTIS